jgi:hypothetical protein
LNGGHPSIISLKEFTDETKRPNNLACSFDDPSAELRVEEGMAVHAAAQRIIFLGSLRVT